jgi:hypothetical protein
LPFSISGLRAVDGSAVGGAATAAVAVAVLPQ